MVAQGLGVRPNTVSGMLSQLRSNGLEKGEARLLEKVFKSLTENDGTKESSSGEAEPLEPKVLVLTRRRDRK